MLRELKKIRQIPGDSPRRWFEDSETDLIVWKNEINEIIGFQYCYCRGRNEKALTWTKEGGYTHESIDDGEDHPLKYKSTPILVPDGEFDALKIANDFVERSKNIDKNIAEFIFNRFLAYS